MVLYPCVSLQGPGGCSSPMLMQLELCPSHAHAVGAVSVPCSCSWMVNFESSGTALPWYTCCCLCCPASCTAMSLKKKILRALYAWLWKVFSWNRLKLHHKICWICSRYHHVLMFPLGYVSHTWTQAPEDLLPLSVLLIATQSGDDPRAWGVRQQSSYLLRFQHLGALNTTHCFYSVNVFLGTYIHVNDPYLVSL